MTSSTFFLLLVFFVSTTLPQPCTAAEQQIDHSGRVEEVCSQSQTRKVTFVNHRKNGDCGLYWVGNGQNAGGPRLFYGPLSSNGGSRSIEGFPGQVFSLVDAGTLHKIAKYTITDSAHAQEFAVTDKDIKISQEVLPAVNSAEIQKKANECRSAASCEDCIQSNSGSCGWSLVRNGCFLAHPIATTSIVLECQYSSTLESPNDKSIDGWLNQANALVLDSKDGPEALRKAFHILQHASKSDKASSVQSKKCKAALAEITAKLDAVFDDQDARELLDQSRHEALAKIHPDMPTVDRRTLEEAKGYIEQGLPVVITDVFTDIQTNVVQKWTLEYLHRKVFLAADAADARFNVAADMNGQCCRYFEPQAKAKQTGYPYPFAPTTHLYRDKFEGFVKTVRKAAGSDKPHKILHYLHEIVMNAQGEAVVAGGAPPQQLKEDIESIKSILQPIAKDQPFFGGFANAKLWMGQQGIIMPLHYDATDNLYVMVWGRKRAIIGPPGQLDALYRYPNDHPLAGSSQVNLSLPELSIYPRFEHAQLQEVVVGPGDVLYLPAWWWHQFEQPFEDTAALNLWSRDSDQAPESSLRDKRVREHSLNDLLERSVQQIFGNATGIVLETLARNKQNAELRAQEALKAGAENWRQWVMQMPGGHPKAEQSADELVAEFLDTHVKVIPAEHWADWQPGVAWNLSHAAVLPRDIRDRCETAPESSPFLSHCA